MNLPMVLRSLGILLICEALLMVPSLAVSIIYEGYDVFPFVYTIALLGATGSAGLSIKPKKKNIYPRDGFAIVAFGWILISFFGSLPFIFSGVIPSFVDAFFETSSGFTTTGASILTSVEGLPEGIMFWRSFTHWVGGMGVLVLTLAILPLVGANTVQIMKAESPGPNPGKLVPKVRQTAKILYIIYFVVTIVEIILLLFGGMSFLDACIHAFGTVGTGGFSNKNLSVGAYNSVYIEVVISVFMIICGANFTLYYQALKDGIKSIFKDEEFRLYIGVVTASILLITFNIHGTIYKSIWESLRHSSFQVASIITTTGYASTNFDLWPTFSKIILFMLMFIGGCAGSTAGAIKNIRILMLFKIMKRELLKIIHPRAVYVLKFGGKVVDDDTLSEVLVYFFMYMMIFAAAVLIISLEGKDFATTVSSIAATLGNIGPGFGMVGPIGNFSEMTNISKLVLSMCMIIGRIEIYPILLMLFPSFWKKVNI
ncbi:Trk system potassium uptake protein TrkG [Oxobacter pfennigii]|uniref:Trk system potassium uptake protein TrkG n=1 Tax=Oxobacter pfennigii TaxID=36849 RepID=A0A0P8Z0Q0_9CLOT|nr:TrkH family potassium uptake protein [Oxobacter pfennigii]KPU45724.1 Trk system potassium uptake protein TrkG [Oxobacter pfennigii]